MVSHIPLGPLGVHGKCKWEFIVKAENGNIYGLPSRATRVLKISPEDRQITCIGPVFGTYPCKWGQGAIANDGKIYCPPASHEQALCIDPETDSVEVFGTSYGLSKTLKWYCAVKAHDGKLYCPPLSFNHVLCIDPATMQTELWGPRLINHKYGWPSGALADNGCIYCCPCNPSRVLMIDPTAQDARTVGPDLGLRESKFFDCVKANDGAFYCAPTLGERALKIKPPKHYNSGSVQVELIGKPLITKGKTWGGGTLGHDGRIYCPPRMGTQILCIDPYKSTTELVGPEIKLTNRKTESKWCAAVEANNGLVYCMPCDASSVLGIDIDTVQYMAQRKAKGSSSNGKPVQMPRAERIRRSQAAKAFAAFRHSNVMSYVRQSAQGAMMTLVKGVQRLLPFQKEIEVKASSYEKEAGPFKPSAMKKKGRDERTEESVSTAGDESSDNGSIDDFDDDDSGSSDSGEIGTALDTALFEESSLFNGRNVQKLTSVALKEPAVDKRERACDDSSSVTTRSSRTSTRKSGRHDRSSSISLSSSTPISIASTPFGIQSPADGTMTPENATLRRITGLMSKLSSKSSTPLSSSADSSNVSTPSNKSSRKAAFVPIAAVLEERDDDMDMASGKALGDDRSIALLRQKLGQLKSSRSEEDPADAVVTMQDQSLPTQKQIEEAMLLCAPSAGGEHRSCGVCGVGDTCAVQ